MVKTNMASGHEIVDMELNSGHGQLYPDSRMMARYMADFPNLNIHSYPSNSVNPTIPFVDHSSSNAFHGSQYKSLQNQQPIPDVEAGYAPPDFVSNPYLASSSGRFYPVPETNISSEQILVQSSQGAMGARMNEFGGSNQPFEYSMGLNKRKNPEMVPWFSNYQNCAASSSSSSNPGLQYLNGSNMFNASYFTQPEQQNDLLPMEDGHWQSSTNRHNMYFLQHEHSVAPHQSHLLQGNSMGQSFHSTSNTWLGHLVGIVGDAGGSSWSHLHTSSATSGRSLNRGSFEMGNYRSLGHQGFTSNRNPVANTHGLPFQNPHHHLQSVQGMHGHNYNHNHISALPYSHSVYTSTYHGGMNHSRGVTNSELRFARPSPFNAPERVYGPSRCPSQEALGDTDIFVDAMSPEDVAVLRFSGFGVDDLNDRHRDMRMDIDDMSYEELLALQEQIGDVNTGLTEEYVLKHLKIRLHCPSASLSLSIEPPSSTLEKGTCIICQVEYEENERIGTLACGHAYHADCIRQWLLVKNLCPICKTTALSVDKRKSLGS